MSKYTPGQRTYDSTLTRWVLLEKRTIKMIKYMPGECTYDNILFKWVFPYFKQEQGAANMFQMLIFE